LTGRPPIVDLTEVNRGNKGKGIVSKILGIPEDSPVSFAEAGKMLYDNSDVMRRLRAAFMIAPCRNFQPGVDYGKQQHGAAAKLQKGLR